MTGTLNPAHPQPTAVATTDLVSIAVFCSICAQFGTVVASHIWPLSA